MIIDLLKSVLHKMLGLIKRIIAGIEAMHLVQKGQTFQGEKSVQNQVNCIYEQFGLTA
jgi:transposase, IS6 family